MSCPACDSTGERCCLCSGSAAFSTQLHRARISPRDRAALLTDLAERTAALAAQTGDVSDLDDAAEACRKAAEAMKEANEAPGESFREAWDRIEMALQAELANPGGVLS